MNEKIIKSADRVKDHGEVFTPKRIVDLMLDQPEFMGKINDLHATFLESSAGKGVFLVALLKRKLTVAMSQSKSASGDFSEWNDIGGNPRKVQRTEYTFKAIVNQDGPTGSVKNSYEQLDLFASNEDAEITEPEKVNYIPCKWTDIYLRGGL